MMRVLRIVEPVQMADGYSGDVAMPRVRSFIHYKGRPQFFLQSRYGSEEAGRFEMWTRHSEEWEWTWSWNK